MRSSTKQDLITNTKLYKKSAHSDYNVCIAGAGVAGASLAAVLGRAGVNVAIIERDLNEPDRIVGELLQPGGVEQLLKLGMAEALDGFDGQEISGYSLFLDGQHFKIDYPVKGNKKFTGRGFRNGKFLTRLRNLLRDLDNVHVIEGQVTNLVDDQNGSIAGFSYKDVLTGESKSIRADLTVVSDGCFSKLRQGFFDEKKKVSGYFLGLKLFDCSLPYPNCGHVVMAEPSPFLIYPIASNEHRVLIDFPGDRPPKRGKETQEFLTRTILPQMPGILKEEFQRAIERDDHQVMPNHRMPAKPHDTSGLVIIGDALNMRHPLTGGGMTVALNDVELLGKKIMQLDSTDDHEILGKVITDFYKERNSNNQTINILADALYGVMREPLLKKACFDYLKRGEQYSAEPIALLGGISKDREKLIRAFFDVARFGARQALKPYPTPKRISKSFKIMNAAKNIIRPLL